MNDYSYEDLFVGQREAFPVEITEKMLDEFRGITGDINPMHNDEGFALEHGYPRRIVYGMLTASFLSTLAGVYLPGRKCLIQSVETKFTNPVYIGDRLLISGTVVELNDSVRQAVIKVLVTNQMGQKVLRGTLKLGVMQG